MISALRAPSRAPGSAGDQAVGARLVPRARQAWIRTICNERWCFPELGSNLEVETDPAALLEVKDPAELPSLALSLSPQKERRGLDTPRMRVPRTACCRLPPTPVGSAPPPAAPGVSQTFQPLCASKL